MDSEKCALHVRLEKDLATMWTQIDSKLSFKVFSIILTTLVLVSIAVFGIQFAMINQVQATAHDFSENVLLIRESQSNMAAAVKVSAAEVAADVKILTAKMASETEANKREHEHIRAMIK